MESYGYLYPPRPEKAVAPEMLGFYERRGWIAQHKLNGTCNVLAISPDRRVIAANRHAEQHRAWAPTEASSRAYRTLPGRGWYVFVAELMHSKVAGIRDTNYLHDVLVADGTHLVGRSFADRQTILAGLFPRQPAMRDDASHYEVDENTWVAKLHLGGFSRLFAGLERPEHEGIVLKNPSAALTLCGRPSANAGWQVKCRRPHQNYSF